MPWTFTQNTLERFKSKQYGPWPAGWRRHGQRRRAGGAAVRASGSARPHAHLGVVGDRSGGREVAGGEVQRRPAAVAAAAREIPARGAKWVATSERASFTRA
jgi:hypothetical protein